MESSREGTLCSESVDDYERQNAMEETRRLELLHQQQLSTRDGGEVSQPEYFEYQGLSRGQRDLLLPASASCSTWLQESPQKKDSSYSSSSSSSSSVVEEETDGTKLVEEEETEKSSHSKTGSPTFKTKKWCSTRQKGKLKSRPKVPGKFVKLFRDDRVDGTVIQNMFRYPHTRRLRTGLKDCEFLELMGNGLGSFFARKAWRRHTIVRGFIVEALSFASTFGRIGMNYRSELRVLNKIRTLRDSNPECFKDPVGRHDVFESKELKKMEAVSRKIAAIMI